MGKRPFGFLGTPVLDRFPKPFRLAHLHFIIGSLASSAVLSLVHGRNGNTPESLLSIVIAAGSAMALALWFFPVERKYQYMAGQTLLAIFLAFAIGIRAYDGLVTGWAFLIPLYSWFFLGIGHAIGTAVVFLGFISVAFFDPFGLGFPVYSSMEVLNAYLVFVASFLCVSFIQIVWIYIPATLDDTLKQKELLIREVYHRTKNNLALVNSLMHIEAREMADRPAPELSDAMAGRIQSILLVNDKLYRSESTTEVDLCEYLRNLVTLSLKACGVESVPVTFGCPAGEVVVAPDAALKIGLIINELIVNSAKYVFVLAKRPKLDFGLNRQSDRTEIMYDDHGPGFDEVSRRSFGMEMVQALVKELASGSLQHQGPVWTIGFEGDGIEPIPPLP